MKCQFSEEEGRVSVAFAFLPLPLPGDQRLSAAGGQEAKAGGREEQNYGRMRLCTTASGRLEERRPRKPGC